MVIIFVMFGEVGWDSKLLGCLGEIWVVMLLLVGYVDELLEIVSLLLINFVECGEVQFCCFFIGGFNVLCMVFWKNWLELMWIDFYMLVCNLVLMVFDEEIFVEDVSWVMLQEVGECREVVVLLLFFDQLLCEVCDVFEKFYFEYYLWLEGGNMIKLVECLGFECMYLYCKLK